MYTKLSIFSVCVRARVMCVHHRYICESTEEEAVGSPRVAPGYRAHLGVGVDREEV